MPKIGKVDLLYNVQGIKKVCEVSMDVDKHPNPFKSLWKPLDDISVFQRTLRHSNQSDLLYYIITSSRVCRKVTEL